MKGISRQQMEVCRKKSNRYACLRVLQGERSGIHAHAGWLDASRVYTRVKGREEMLLESVYEALEYLADKGYVQFQEKQTDISEAPVVVYRIVAHGQDLLDGVIDNDPGVDSEWH